MSIIRKVKVLTVDGEREWDLLAEDSGLGVTYNADYDNYTVTHLNTGYKIGMAFRTEECARGFMESVSRLHPWTEIKTNKDAKLLKGNGLGARVNANYELWRDNEVGDEIDHL